MTPVQFVCFQICQANIVKETQTNVVSKDLDRYDQIHVISEEQLADINIIMLLDHCSTVQCTIGFQPKASCDVTDRQSTLFSCLIHSTFHVWLYNVHKKYPRAPRVCPV